MIKISAKRVLITTSGVSGIGKLMLNSLTFVKGILPTRVFDWFVGKVLGVYKSMDDFKRH